MFLYRYIYICIHVYVYIYIYILCIYLSLSLVLSLLICFCCPVVLLRHCQVSSHLIVCVLGEVRRLASGKIQEKLITVAAGDTDSVKHGCRTLQVFEKITVGQ